MATASLIGTLVLDAGPIISNTTLPKAGIYFTTPSVLAELKDENVRTRIQSLYTLQTRSPKRSSIEFVRTFAKKTGDAEVLSATDIGIIALTYELECELNGGDWRLRNTPGQARINGKPPTHEFAPDRSQDESATTEHALQDLSLTVDRAEREHEKEIERPDAASVGASISIEPIAEHQRAANDIDNEDRAQNSISQEPTQMFSDSEEGKEEEAETEAEDDDDDWITPSNIKKHQEKDANIDGTAQDVKTMKVACATHDFALQNVLLQIGLNLVSGDGIRISSVKTWVLRCHACFKVTRKMNLKFCPTCGGATLMRTSVSTDAKGAMKVHLKRNMQWNNRGTVYSIPKQQHGTANMKGRDNLILRADQREVEKLEKRDKYKKEIDLLDPDYIPSIVSGRRDMNGTSIKVGHGRRNPNSNRKH